MLKMVVPKNQMSATVPSGRRSPSPNSRVARPKIISESRTEENTQVQNSLPLNWGREEGQRIRLDDHRAKSPGW